MKPDRMLTIGTCGGCGEIARRLLDRVPESIPCLRYDAEGEAAVHAAVMVGGRYIHLGSDHRLVEVSREEFERACREDFDCDRTGATEEELEAVVSLLLEDCR